MQTVSDGGRGIVVIAADGQSYSFGYDYLPYDTSAPIEPDAVLWTEALPASYKLSADSQIIFNSQGRVIDKDGVLNSVGLSFVKNTGGTDTTYATATLTATGVLNIN